MAILNDLIVTNSAKVLSTVYADGFSRDSTVTIRPEFNNEVNFYPKDSAQTTLHVNYRGGMSTFYVCNGAGASGTVKAGTFNATSDRRLKENLKEYTNLNESSILDLPIYTYDFINGLKNLLGCMAQDLLKICPEIVSEGEDGYLSILESKITYLLLTELKKLRAEFDEYKKLHP